MSPLGQKILQVLVSDVFRSMYNYVYNSTTWEDLLLGVEGISF